MMNLTVNEIAQAVNGKTLAYTDVKVSFVNTDSRTAGAGQLFIPLVGERFDGHAYIDNALNAGAEGCLTQTVPDVLLENKFYILVNDTTIAYKELARWYRMRFDIPFVQITGSAGKTTTKEMIASVLSQKYKTLKTEANYNNAIGTPRTLLNLEPKHEAAVIETGMNHFGEIHYLGEMVMPDIAVITNVGDAHIENLGGTRQGTLKAKCEIFDFLKENGVAVLCGDDELLSQLKLPYDTYFCGRNENCNVRVDCIVEHGIDGLSFRVTTKNDVYDLTVSSPGAYMIYPASMAVAVGEILGVSHEQIVTGIANYVPTGARMHIIRQNNGKVIIDDCYNANPQSMYEALKLLTSTNTQHQVAVLGDMGELGDLSEKAHRDLGLITKKFGIETVIAIGTKSAWIKEENVSAMHFETVDEAMPYIIEMFKDETVMLVKASHAMNFQKIVKELEK